MSEKKAEEKATEIIEEVKEVAEEATETISEATNSAKENLDKSIDKSVNFLTKITDKVRDIVLKFGEIIITSSVIIGLVSAIINGLATMGNIGFFTGLSSMFTDIVGVVMGALVLFLLFGIYKNGSKD